jgi:hypothetical protein
MCSRKYCFLTLLILLSALMAGLAVTPKMAYANQAQPISNHDTCINCHEDLYFLHDTGKWFCLREAPMACVDCHDGDPTAVTKDKAHTNRAAYPVINENITKCQECHPEKSSERVQIFKEVAGISPVIVAVAYVPVAVVSEPPMHHTTGHEHSSDMNGWQPAIIIVALIGLMIVWVSRIRRRKETPR